MCGGVRYNNLSPAIAVAAHDDDDDDDQILKIQNRSIHDEADGDDLLLIPPPCPAPSKSSTPVGLSIIIVDPPSEEDNNNNNNNRSRSAVGHETLGGVRGPSLTEEEDVVTGEKLAAAHKDMVDQGKAPRIEGGGGVGPGQAAGVGRPGGRPVIGDGGRVRGHGHGHGHGHCREQGGARCRSIFFTAASPPPPAFVFPRPVARSHSLPASFGECFWCTRPLTPHTDLYMYRGDRAFCSSECRYKQMDVDEQNERQTVNITWKHDQSSNNNKVNYHATTVEIVG